MLATLILSVVLLASALLLLAVRNLAGRKDGFKPGHACRMNKSSNK